MTMMESHSCPEQWLACWAGTNRDLEAGVGGRADGTSKVWPWRAWRGGEGSQKQRQRNLV